MKSKLLFPVIFLLFISYAHAQETSATFANKDNVIGIGFGIGGAYGINSFSAQSPAFGIQYDRGIYELKNGMVIGAGGYFGYKSITNKFSTFSNNYKQRWSYIIIGARGTVHYDLFRIEKLDTYAGTMIAYYILDYSDNYDGGTNLSRNYASAAYLSVFAGAKYYFVPQVAAFAEAGYGVSWLTLGMAFKF